LGIIAEVYKQKMFNTTQDLSAEQSALRQIESLDTQLSQHFKEKFCLQSAFTRPIVSFQANKTRPIYRWYKYKEAFSASLVEYLFQKYEIPKGKILDPFAGSGTSLFATSALGFQAEGIELLPIGQQLITVKKFLEAELTAKEIQKLEDWARFCFWEQTKIKIPLNELRITQGAYPEETKVAIEQYLGAAQQNDPQIQAILQFVLLCVLETVSYTRKDGQYLRWDYRSGRKQGKKPFNKGVILSFAQAIRAKMAEINTDLTASAKQTQMGLFCPESTQNKIELYPGSCLKILPMLPADSYEAIITSPPYCNRYDYTRTYALELALMGIDEKTLTRLRQEMLSCTVENRAKDLLALNPQWLTAITAAAEQNLLQAILSYLESQKAQGLLNNNGIPRMVRGYFYEMACVLAECARVLKPNSFLFMVNDNVRYAGASISVDLILADLAEKLGFEIDNIFVLPNGKGNSSQQMGEYGREKLRKCVYVWRKR